MPTPILPKRVDQVLKPLSPLLKAEAGGSRGLYRIILEQEWSEGQPRYAYLLAEYRRGYVAYRLSHDEAEAFAAFESPSDPISETIREARLDESSLGCWDTNPASFHALAIENIGRRNIGFVMDRTRSAQVWNQPVSKVVFELGRLMPLGESPETPGQKAYRAPGTSYVADVTATVTWSGEPGLPFFTYRDGVDSEYLKTSTFKYSLEFDADQRLIGGEWTQTDGSTADENPDFLFGFGQAAEPELSQAQPYLREGYPSIIKKLHDCSLREAADGETTLWLDVGFAKQQKLSYVNCKL